MIADLVASGIEIPDSNPSSGKEDDGDCKMVANKKNSNLTKINKRRKWSSRRPLGNTSCMFYDHVAVALVWIVQSTCSQSNHSRIWVELDSHAATSVVSPNVIVVHDHEHSVDVYGFDKETRHSNSHTLNAAIAYNEPITHSTVILMINQAIKIDNMYRIPIYPMQCCAHGTLVHEYPKFLSASPVEYDHAFLVHDLDGCSPLLTIPVSLNGVTSYFEARCLSLAEYEDKNILKYHFIYKSPPWDPSTSFYSLQEDGKVDYKEWLIAWFSTDPDSTDMAVSSVVSTSYTTVDITDNENFAAVLSHHVKVDMTTTVQTACLTTLQWKLTVDSNTLAQHWGILLHKAKRIVQHTTQCGVWNITNPTLVCKFCTNDCIFQYCCLHRTIFTDTIFISTLSRWGN